MSIASHWVWHTIPRSPCWSLAAHANSYSSSCCDKISSGRHIWLYQSWSPNPFHISVDLAEKWRSFECDVSNWSNRHLFVFLRQVKRKLVIAQTNDNPALRISEKLFCSSIYTTQWSRFWSEPRSRRIISHWSCYIVSWCPSVDTCQVSSGSRARQGAGAKISTLSCFHSTYWLYSVLRLKNAPVFCHPVSCHGRCLCFIKTSDMSNGLALAWRSCQYCHLTRNGYTVIESRS